MKIFRGVTPKELRVGFRMRGALFVGILLLTFIMVGGNYIGLFS